MHCTYMGLKNALASITWRLESCLKSWEVLKHALLKCGSMRLCSSFWHILAIQPLSKVYEGSWNLCKKWKESSNQLWEGYAYIYRSVDWAQKRQHHQRSRVLTIQKWSVAIASMLYSAIWYANLLVHLSPKNLPNPTRGSLPIAKGWPRKAL